LIFETTWSLASDSVLLSITEAVNNPMKKTTTATVMRRIIPFNDFFLSSDIETPI
jgi:hypothetical protein